MSRPSGWFMSDSGPSSGPESGFIIQRLGVQVSPLPSRLLFGLAAVGNFVIALIAYRGGRLVIPIILAVAGLCFVIAAGGAARGAGGGRA